MPRLEPFRGLRYDPHRVDFDDVISPPYDIIGADERARLAARSRFNSVLIELPVDDATRGLDRYQHAATLLDAWERDGILVRDERPSLYVYRMTFRDETGAGRSTTGVIGALGLDDEGGEVLPHEGTVAKFSQDRLDLLRACQVNISPIWCLSLADGLSKALSSAIGLATDHHEATDDDGVVHGIWQIDDVDAIAEITARVHPEPFVIADGHHRFETASCDRMERRSLNGNEPGDFDFLMTFVVELRPDELDVRPIHRVISGLPEATDVAAILGSLFRVEESPGTVRDLLHEMATHNVLGLVTSTKLFLIEPPHPESGNGVDDALEHAPARSHRRVAPRSCDHLRASSRHRGRRRAIRSRSMPRSS